MKHRIIISIIIIVFTFSLIPISFAHQDGCHRWHSCPSDSGSYTCGDTGHCSECPDNQYCKVGKPYTEYIPPKYETPKEPLKPSPKISDYSEPAFSTKVQFDGKNFIPSKISATNKVFLENTSKSSVEITIKSYHTIGSQAFSQEESITIMPNRVQSIQMPIPITDPILSQITFISQSGSLLLIDNQGKNDYHVNFVSTLPVSTSPVPEWIKNNAKWWSSNQINDSEFLRGIEYLIKENIIKIKTTSIEKRSSDIPLWIKNNAKWWSEGKISEDDFIKGIKYLAENGLIQTHITNNSCKGTADCISGKVTKIVDGDTIHVNEQSIRLALTATPELDEKGGQEAKSFTSQFCSIGSSVIVDEDDKQIQGSYGRMIGQIFCNDKSLNEALLENNLAIIDSRFCSKSEFSSEPWAIKFGC